MYARQRNLLSEIRFLLNSICLDDQQLTSHQTKPRTSSRSSRGQVQNFCAFCFQPIKRVLMGLLLEYISIYYMMICLLFSVV